MTKRLIPNGDTDFKIKASAFARNVARQPERFGLTAELADEMMTAALHFEKALQEARYGNPSRTATRAKDEARAECERIYRRCVKIIRFNEDLDAGTLITVGLRPAQTKRASRTVPAEPPRLKFLRALHEGGGSIPVHELEFRGLESRSRPAGAMRLELFVDLIPPDEPIPAHPAVNLASRPWYLRSFTRSPIKLVPPMARVPMRVVYWGRWADAVGNVGPFSATAAAWIEGGSHASLPGGTGMGRIGKPPPPLLEEASLPGPAGRERTYVVAVLEAQFASLAGMPEALAPKEVPALPAPSEREAPRLEDQSEKEAA